MVQPCEVTVGTLKKAISTWRRSNMKPVSKMRVKDLEQEFINFPLADQFLPSGHNTESVNAATARRAISAYRRQEHPSLSKQGIWDRNTLEIYMTEFSVPLSLSKYGAKLKRDKCDDDERPAVPKPLSRGQAASEIARMRQQLNGDDGVVTLNPRKKAAKRRVAPIPVASLQTKKPRRKKRKAASAGDAVMDYLQGDEFAARARAMDAADSSLAW
jgi:hypothetical protein